MSFIDISWPITKKMTTYKDRKDIEIHEIACFEKDQVRQSSILIGSHTGTHIDAPTHFLESGKTVDEISLDSLIGPCEVIDLSFVDGKITQQDLTNVSITKGSRVLFKTKNSALEPTALFKKDFIAIDFSAAEFLVDCKVQTVGLDYLGIERNDPAHYVHKLFMNKNIAIIEGLRLGHVAPGSYHLMCLPLSLPGLEAAPARALLQKK